MSVYHVQIEAEDDWYVLRTVEDEGVFSQSRTLDEAVVMMRDVIYLMKEEKDMELRLIIPADLPVNDTKVSGRIDPGFDDEAQEIHQAKT